MTEKKIDLTSAHYELIATDLSWRAELAEGKWFGCSWKHEIGRFACLDLKGRTSTDLMALEAQARDRVHAGHIELPRLADKANPDELNKLILDLALDIDVIESYPEAVAYLRYVEHCAALAEDTAMSIVRSFFDGDIKDVGTQLELLSFIESARESGKPVWKNFRITASSYVHAIKFGWCPRVVLSKLDQKFKHPIILGCNVANSLERLYTAETWAVHEGDPTEAQFYSISTDGDKQHFKVGNRQYRAEDVTFEIV